MANIEGHELVASPATDEWDYGLFDAATVRTTDGRWQHQGFVFATDQCPPGTIWEYDNCFVPIPADAEKSVEPGIDYQPSSPPITTYSGVACTPIGIGDAPDQAEQRLANVAPKLIERYFWDRILTQDAENLTPGGAVSPEIGLGLLQHRLRWNYAGTGILHVPSRAASVINELIETTEPYRTTRLGTRFAFGGGYDINTETGQPAFADQVTVVATGAVLIYRSSVFVPATLRTGAFDHKTNLAQVFAEQTYAISYDCAGPWAVTLTLSGGA